QTQMYVFKNDCAMQVTVDTAGPSGKGVLPPFSVVANQSLPATIAAKPGGSVTFTITYDGRGQTSQSTERLIITTTGGGKVTLTLIGIPLTNCFIPPPPP